MNDRDNRNLKEQWDIFKCNRALEMLQSGEGSDFVIEVHQQKDAPQEKILKSGRRTLQPRRKSQASSSSESADGQFMCVQKFNVHKYVLMATSEVFRAMFTHKNTEESRESRLQIKDSTVIAVQQMLNYMYAGEIPPGYDVNKDAVALISIAHKYQLKPLVDFNEQKLVESVSMENVVDLLKLADLYQTNSLKAACGKIIRMNLEEVKKMDKWIELKTSSPQLVISVLEETRA